PRETIGGRTLQGLRELPEDGGVAELRGAAQAHAAEALWRHAVEELPELRRVAFGQQRGQGLVEDPFRGIERVGLHQQADALQTEGRRGAPGELQGDGQPHVGGSEGVSPSRDSMARDLVEADARGSLLEPATQGELVTPLLLRDSGGVEGGGRDGDLDAAEHHGGASRRVAEPFEERLVRGRAGTTDLDSREERLLEQPGGTSAGARRGSELLGRA